MPQQKKQKQTIDLFTYERRLRADGVKLIAGIDEVGRGPLAGPVVSACVIMPELPVIEDVNDSKKLSEKKREYLFEKIMEVAVASAIGSVSPDIIDEINILNATKRSMQQAVKQLSVVPDIVLIDAVKLELPLRSLSIIHGDALSYSIAAASIVAKVTRDRLMRAYAKEYPHYGFEQHKGYGTKQHIEALKKYGPLPIHRKSFLKNLELAAADIDDAP